jgi:hypothetical protein
MELNWRAAKKKYRPSFRGRFMNPVVTAGFAKVDITPPLDQIEAHGIGYWYQRSVRFTAVRDPLYARTLVLNTNGFRGIIISVDSIFDSYEFVPEATHRIAETLGIDPDHVFITCTHTHSSPLIDRNNTRQGVEYGPFATERIVQSAIAANVNSVAANVFISAGPVRDVLYNRRPLLKNGHIPELHQPLSKDLLADAGPINDTMTIVKFLGNDGKLIGGLCHFGIHGVAVQCSELISSDCMGRAIQRTEAECGGVLLHLNGACGDIDPIAMGSDEALETMTARLAAGIRGTLAAEERSIQSPVIATARLGRFRAARRATRPAGWLEKERGALLGAADEQNKLRHHSGAGYEAFLLAEEEKVSALPPEFDVPYQILRFGPVTLVGIGGEVFTRCGMALQSIDPESYVLPVGLTGGAAGYLPTKEMYEQGGYEVACAGWCPIAPGETEKFFDQVGRDLQGILRSGSS